MRSKLRLGLLALGSVMCLSLPQIVSAQESYESTAAIPSVDYQPYIQAISDQHNYFIVTPQAGGTLAERTNRRNAQIRRLFDRIAREREPLYVAYRSKRSEHIKCKLSSHSGGTKRCPSEINWGDGHEVIPASMGDTRRHFKDGPTNHGTKITAVLGRAGRGENHGDFWGTAKLSAGEVQRRVEADKEALRQLLIARNLPTDRALDMEVE